MHISFIETISNKDKMSKENRLPINVLYIFQAFIFFTLYIKHELLMNVIMELKNKYFKIFILGLS